MFGQGLAHQWRIGDDEDFGQVLFAVGGLENGGESFAVGQQLAANREQVKHPGERQEPSGPSQFEHAQGRLAKLLGGRADENVRGSADQRAGAAEDGREGERNEQLGRLQSARAASEIMMGMNTTTTGVLLMKAEISATMGSTTSSSDQSLLPTARFSRWAMDSMTPVRSSAALRMNMHATVMAASLLNTLNASAWRQNAGGQQRAEHQHGDEIERQFLPDHQRERSGQ